jgi:hypothetical protein
MRGRGVACTRRPVRSRWSARWRRQRVASRKRWRWAWTRSKGSGVRRETRHRKLEDLLVEAVDAARRNAEGFAQAAERPLGGIVAVEEQST